MTSQDSVPGKKRCKSVIVTTLALGVVVLGGLYISSVKSRKIIVETPTESGIEQEAEKSGGLMELRSSIIDHYENEIGYSFKLGDPVDGYENYIGTKKTSFIQLFGSEDELVFASINGYYGGDNTGSLSQENVSEFAATTYPASLNWLTGEFELLNRNGCDEFKSQKQLGQVEFMLTCSLTAQKLKMISLSFRSIAANLQ